MSTHTLDACANTHIQIYFLKESEFNIAMSHVEIKGVTALVPSLAMTFLDM